MLDSIDPLVFGELTYEQSRYRASRCLEKFWGRNWLSRLYLALGLVVAFAPWIMMGIWDEDAFSYIPLLWGTTYLVFAAAIYCLMSQCYGAALHDRLSAAST